MEAALGRIEALADGADFALIKGLVATLMRVMGMMRAERGTMARLRRFLGISSSEKTAAVLGEEDKPSAMPLPATSAELAATPEPAGAGGNAPPTCEAPPAEPKKKPTGHGRVPASEYQRATHIPISHQSLSAGCACPGCERGKLRDLQESAQFLRIVGQPVLTLTISHNSLVIFASV